MDHAKKERPGFLAAFRELPRDFAWQEKQRFFDWMYRVQLDDSVKTTETVVGYLAVVAIIVIVGLDAYSKFGG